MAKIFTFYWGSYFKSGRHAENMALEFQPLIERGWVCHLVMAREPEDPEWLAGMRKLGVEISFLPRPRGRFDLKNIMAIRRLCIDTRCNLFRCDNLHMNPLIGAALAGVPYKIWVKHSMNAHYEACREPELRERVALTTRLSALLSTRVIAVSSAVGAELTDLGIPSNKVFVLNNPRPEFKPSGISRDEIRRTWNIPDDALVFVNIGRAEKVKGWDILLKAFAKVAEVNSRSRLLLVGAKDVRGDVSFMKILEEMVSDLGLAERVSFAGHVIDVSAMLQAADVFVLPSRSEGGGIALLEALELGLPCVATRVGHASEVIQNGQSGILVARNHPEELATALLSLMSDERKRTSMASHARIPDHVPDPRRHAEIMAGLYENLISESPDPELTKDFHQYVNPKSESRSFQR